MQLIPNLTPRLHDSQWSLANRPWVCRTDPPVWAVPGRFSGCNTDKPPRVARNRLAVLHVAGRVPSPPAVGYGRLNRPAGPIQARKLGRERPPFFWPPGSAQRGRTGGVPCNAPEQGVAPVELIPAGRLEGGTHSASMRARAAEAHKARVPGNGCGQLPEGSGSGRQRLKNVESLRKNVEPGRAVRLLRNAKVVEEIQPRTPDPRVWDRTYPFDARRPGNPAEAVWPQGGPPTIVGGPRRAGPVNCHAH